MLKKLAILVCVVAVSSTGYAQQNKTAAPGKKVSTNTEQSKPEPTAKASAEAPPQPVNTRIDLTITDQRAEGAPIVKTVSIMTADRYWGRIRTQGDIQIGGPGGGRFPVILNVDARPTLVGTNRARVELTIEYRPADEIVIPNNGNPTSVPTSRRDPQGVAPNINESLAVILDDGKSVLISQSADPVTDRKVKVEAKLAILR